MIYTVTLRRFSGDVSFQIAADCQDAAISAVCEMTNKKRSEIVSCVEHHKNPAAVALGKMTSPAKARAAAENGKKGGRTKKARPK